MKRKIIAAGVILACLGFCACGTAEKNAQTEDAKKAESLVIWAYYETAAQKAGLNRLVRDFNQSQNQYQVSWEYVPMTGFSRKLSSAYTENALPDMAILDNPDMPAMIQMGLFEDITAEVEGWKLHEEYYPSIMETVSCDGRYYGVPFNCNSTALIYNKELLNAENIEPPATWEEFRAAAEKLTTKERSGFMMCCIDGEQGAFQILPWLLAAGEQGDTLGGKATEEAFGFLQTLVQDGSISENCINLTQTDLAREFIAGKTAMMQNGPWIFPALKEAGVSYGVTGIPGKNKDNAVVGGENIGILKGKNVEGSAAFMKFLMEGNSLEEFCRQASVLTPKIKSAGELDREEEALQVFEQQMEHAVTRTSIPSWSSVSKKLTGGMFGIISGEMNARDAAKLFKKS